MSDEWRIYIDNLVKWIDGQYAEIERLKAELRVAYQLPSAVEHAADAELRAEIERLRAALKPMVEHFNVGGGKVPIGKMLEDACKALEGK